MADLPPSLASTLEQLNKSPSERRKSSRNRRTIEHYNPPSPSDTKPKSNDMTVVDLQREANYNTANANLLMVKSMLLQSRHKLYDMEHLFEEMEESGVKKTRLDRQMKVVREVFSHTRELEATVKTMEADIAQRFSDKIVQI